MVLFLIILCSIPQPSLEMESPYYFTNNYLPEVDKQAAIAVYSVLGPSEDYSVEHSVLMRSKKQHFSPEEKKIHPQPTNELVNLYYSTCNHLPDVDIQEVTGVYSVISGSEVHSAEQPDYLNVTKPRKQQLSLEEKKIQPQPSNVSESLSARIDQESQKMSGICSYQCST